MGVEYRWSAGILILVGLLVGVISGACGGGEVGSNSDANQNGPDNICEAESIDCGAVEGECGLFDDGCGGEVDCGLCPDEERLEIRPEEVLLAVGESAELEVFWRTVDEESPVTEGAVWESLTPDVVTVDTDGVVEAIAHGQGRVQVVVDEQSAQRRIDVAGPAEQAVLSLSSGPVHVEEEVEVDVSFYDGDGIPTVGVPLQWSVEDEDVVIVEDGVLRGITTGTTTVSAAGDGFSADLEVEVYFHWAQVAAGETHSCGLSAVGVAYCWGRNNRGQLGNGDTVDQFSPVAVDSEVRFEALSLGDRHSCGHSLEGPVYCWGDNNRGQVGVEFDDEEPNIIRPVEVQLRRAGGQNDRLDFTSINTGREYNCGASTTGEVYCWGYNIHGQIGLNPANSETVQDRPRRVALDGADAREVGTAYFFVCAVMDDESMRCWGRQGPGIESLESEGGGSFVYPQELDIANISGLTGLKGGADFLCGVDADDGLWCWGANGSGQLGQGDIEDRDEPQQVGALGVGAYSASNLHGCAVDADDGGVLCWGANPSNQVGPQPTNPEMTPRSVDLPDDEFISVAAGIAHSCAVSSEGRAFCWGSEGFGRLGADEAGSDGIVEVPQF